MKIGKEIRDGMEEKTMLSQGEWRIMNLLWEKKNRTIMETVDDSDQRTN